MKPLLTVVLLALAARTASGQFNHVFLLLEENRNYASVIGDTVNAPYFNQLADRYGRADEFYAVTHPSIGNYFMLATGQVVTNDDGFAGVYGGDNIVRRLDSAGIEWKAYADGYPGGAAYVDRHNVYVFLSDVRSNPLLRARIVDASRLDSDLVSHSLPRFGIIIPDLQNDGHDGTLLRSDRWAQEHLTPLLESPEFSASGLLIVTWDESKDDYTYGGGRIATILASSRSKPAYRSTSFTQHPSILRLILKSLGVTSYPGAAAVAPDMDEYFLAGSPQADSGAGTLLLSNFPNPFTLSTTLRYRLPEGGNVSLRIFDPLGRLVGEVDSGSKGAGSHDALWHPEGVSSGVYVAELRGPGGRRVQKMVYLK
jgi:phosphatidylinositol-3-phosphatase